MKTFIGEGWEIMPNSSGSGRKEHIEMDLKWNPGRVSHLDSAADLVPDLSWRGNLNPSPLIKDDGELLVDEYLSPRKLKILTGVDDLQQVNALEMRVDTRENSLGSFGAYLPNLRELKLNNSLLMSVRDLGTTLSHLYVLWMAHCGLSDLDGISSCSSLREPDYNYRAEVKKLIPHLEYLDEIPASQTALLPSNKMHEDWLIIKESIKEGGLAGDISWLDPCLGAVARQSRWNPRPPTTSRPGTAQSSAHAGRSSSTCFLYGVYPLPDPTVSDELFTEDDSSDLIHGLSQVTCGSHTEALCARRQKLGPSAVSPLKLCDLRTENLYSSAGGGSLHQEDVFCELSAKREQQKRCLHRGQQEKVTQTLRITLSDEEEGEDSSLTDSCEGALSETRDKDLIERISLDSSCHSCLSQSSSGSSQAQEGAVFSNPNRCLIPSPPKTPSPASVTGVAAKPWKKRNHRIRCLKTPSQEDRQCIQQCQPRVHQEISTQPLGKKFTLLSQHSVPAASGSPGQHQPVGSTGRQRPVSVPTAVGSTSIRPIVNESPPGEINHHWPAVCSSTKASQRSGLMNTAWPLTARAMLQPLPHRPTSSTSQKSPVIEDT
ncbi:leucine-rich repeat-containing protein 56 isoform 3-T3 [Ara ararauna]